MTAHRTTMLFDLDDTLVLEMASEEASLHAAAELARDLVGIAPEAFVRTLARCAEGLWREGPHYAYAERIGFASWEGLWARYDWPSPEMRRMQAWGLDYQVRVWSETLADLGHADAPAADAVRARYLEERARRHIACNDAAPALERLRRTHRLGLVTNGCPDIQRRKLGGSGLAHFFDAIVVTGEVGVGKPDPEPLRVALRMLAARAEDAAMVGNSLVTDVGGAKNAGVLSVWLNRDGSWTSEAGARFGAPDVEIRGLAELPEALDGH